jgi:hypothetical protein
MRLPCIALALTAAACVITHAFASNAPAHACDPEIQLEAFFATASSYIQTEAEHWHEHSYQYDPLNKPEVKQVIGPLTLECELRTNLDITM